MSTSRGSETEFLKRNSFARAFCLIAVLLFCLLQANAAPPPAGIAPVVVPAGGFAIDGDLLGNVPNAGIGDWVSDANGLGGVLNASGVPLNPATTFHFVDPYNSSADTSFGGGLKWTDNPNSWSWTTGKPSSKTDINNVLLHVTTDADGHTWLIIAADRLSTSGDSYIDFEFLQNPLLKNTNGSFSSAGPNGGRTANDVLLSLAFTSGGSVPDFLAFRWLANGSGGFAYTNATTSLPTGRVFVAANTVSVPVPFGAFGQNNYSANAFAEAAIDLTAFLGGFDPCLSIGVKTIMVKTKTSPSSTATIVDFIDPIQYSLHIGPSADAGADQVKCQEADSTTFSLNGIASPGLYPITSTTWSVISGTATIDSPSSLNTSAHVTSQGATLRLTATQSNGCIETDDIVLSVVPRPTYAISGPAEVCPRSSSQFAAPPGLTSYSWAITGNGVISGRTNLQTVTVLAGSDCGSNYVLSLVAVTNICTTTASFETVVNDATAPTLTVPANLVLECPADTRTNATGTATAQDNCGVAGISYSDSVTNLCGGTKVIARMWTAIDFCGNAASATQLITVQDTRPPAIIAPSNLVLECPADTGTNATGVATAQDSCGSVLIGFTDSVAPGCGGSEVITRRWTAVDQCGNSSSAIQTITVRDTTRPTLQVPPALVLECPADTTTNATGVATAQDTCGSVQVSYSDVTTNRCGGTKVISRLWTAIDECGNLTNGLQTLTVRDTQPPSLLSPPNLVLECPADTRTNFTGTATASDGCGSVTLTFSDIVSNTCGGSKVITRTWRATDACGNVTNALQTITVHDTTAPSLVIPSDLVLECPADTRTNNTGVASATDECSAVSVRYSDVITGDCGGSKTIIRTWTATDACGNQTNADQTITLRDTTAPSLVVPHDFVLECPADTSTNVTGVAISQDVCSAATVTYSDSVSNACGGTRVISRLWTASDSCGNSTNRIQRITVQDTTPPSLVRPADLVLECPADTRTNATGVALAQDACSSVTLTFSDVVSNSCGGTKVISRLWTAVDSCGNTSNSTQRITVRDTTAPSLIVPHNLVLECPADTRTNNTGIAISQDACGSVSLAYSDVVSNSCGGSKIISRTWTAVDACGNATNGLQTIAVRDTTPPSLVSPANLVLECPADTSTNATGAATATDGCGSVQISYSDIVSNSCGGARLISRFWTAVDQCGNSTNALQTISVRDTGRPIFSVPPDVALECPAADTSTNRTGVATAQDTCGSVMVSFSDIVSNSCGAARVVFRTWTATDGCGNTTNRVQTITVRDTTSPSLIVPANLVLECPANTTTNATGIALSQDGCGTVTVRYSDSISNLCGGAKIIRRLWTAVDQCGNSTNGLQTITVRDTTSPSLIVPANLVLECPANTTTNATGIALSQDGCGSVSVTYSDVVSNSCGGSKVISRLWTATDGCGNITNGLQTITVRDTIPPGLRLPANLVQECPGDTRTNVTGVAIATEPCGAVTMSYSDVVSNSCGLTRTVMRLWTATDGCGNTTNGMQTITIRDTTAPRITLPSIAVQCLDDVPPSYASLAALQAAGGNVTDACSPTLEFSFISDSGLIGSCPGRVTRVYRATDACGNFADSTQTIVVDDTIAPVLSCPTNATVECGNSIDPAIIGAATATDNCSTNVAITYADSMLSSQYDLKLYGADSDVGTGPYGPTYVKLSPASLPCPTSAQLTGRAADPLRNAVAYSTNSQLDALTSMSGAPMYFGQIVPFEAVIQASGAPGPERGTIEFTATWATYTTSNNRFGFDTNYMVYCAFVDIADPGEYDQYDNARVESVRSRMINVGTPAEAIEGTFRVSGIDSGDRIVVEIWTVLMSNEPDHTGGTIAVDLVSAQKATSPPEPITIGTQTTSIGQLNKIEPLPAPQQQPPLGPLATVPPSPPGRPISVINRTWTATDTCGNRGTCAQQIIVRDAAPPVVVLPPDLVLEFPAADTTTNATGVAQASDVCSPPVTLSYSDSVTQGCGDSQVIRRTWTAIDGSGNSTNAVQTITIGDTTPPALTVPGDVVLEYPSAQTGTNVTGAATATDASGAVTVAFSDAISNVCGNAYIIFRTWTATDVCSNASTLVQQISVLDTTAPTLLVPRDLVLEYPADTTTNSTGVATASDIGGAITVSFSDVVSNTCANCVVIRRTWTATDACGNSSSAEQQITVLDTQPPMLIVPADRVLEYPADTATNATGVAIATDLSAVTVTFSDIISNTCGTCETISRTWTAVDACGNRTSAVQTITLQDTTPPVIQVALVKTFSLDQLAGVAVTDVLSANYQSVFRQGISVGLFESPDQLSSTHGLYYEASSQGLSALQLAFRQLASSSGPLTISGTNSADLAGGGQLAQQALALTVNIGFNNAGVSTPAPNNFASLIYNKANDSLSGSQVAQVLTAANRVLAGQALPDGYTFNSLALLLKNLNDAFLTAGASDWAGSYLSEPKLAVDCAGKVPAPDSREIIVTDNSGGPLTITNLPDVISEMTCPNNFVVTRTWTARDACGNSSSAQVRIEIADTIAPVLTVNSNLVVKSNDSWQFDEPFATDNCGTATVAVTGTTTNITSASTIVTRTWQATDACGNSTSASQSVTIIPVEPPTITSGPQGQAIAWGSDLVLTVSASGPGPLHYQWSLNGVAIAGATGSSLGLNDVDFANAGRYTVTVSNSGGSVTTGPAFINVEPVLNARLENGFIILTWPAPFILQSAASPAGPYLDVPGATSPYSIPASAPQQFFRLRGLPFDIRVQYSSTGIATLNITGTPGLNFIIQASSDFNTWVNLQTNTAPCTYVDVDSGAYAFRFYRVLLLDGVDVLPPVITTQPLSRTLEAGQPLALSVDTSGAGPLLYQWLRNGQPVYGATSSSLQVPAVNYANGGVYSVLVGNHGGTVSSESAVVNVLAHLQSERIGASTLILSWPAGYVLQSAPQPAGPYTDVSGAVSPHTENAVGGTSKFFRLRTGDFSLKTTKLSDGSTKIEMSGPVGLTAVLQATSKSYQWQNLATNMTPSVYFDADSAVARSYRCILAR